MKKVLIANRGEIAVRVIRTCRDVGLATVAVYSTCDRNALHVRLADQAYAIGPDEASESYLRVDKLIDVARRSGATAVHPGYGFLAENPEFAEACSRAGLVFIGPSAEQMRAMGSKTSAREIAGRAGVGVVPGTGAPFGPDASEQELTRAAEHLGFPLLVKAVAGGGGKGMRAVRALDGLAAAVALSRSEALSSFGDARVYFERQLERPRHIEVQLLGDCHGNVTGFVERECSIQRRHQKLIEETPSAAVTPELRRKLIAAAEAIGRAAGYTSAGTIEFLVDASGRFYFLEMNTRLQVEHPVTEAVTGLDLVRAQIEIAQGKAISDLVVTDQMGSGFSRANGHAIEVRVYAEDPVNGFLPSPGRITHLRAPAGPGIRDDSGAYEGWVVPTAYDPMVSKVIVWAPDRQGAIARMIRALEEYDLRGIATTIGFCRQLVASPAFAAADFDTTTVDRMIEQGSPNPAQRDEKDEEMAAIAAALWEVARLKSSPTHVSDPTGIVAGDVTSSVGRGFSRATSLGTASANRGPSVTFDVAVDGRGWTVAIEYAEQPGDLAAVVKGRTRQINASWIDADTLSLFEQSSAREIRFQRRPDGTLLVAFDGKSFEAVVHNARLKPHRSEPVGRDFRHAVKAPMPGRVVRVLVAVGDRVTAKQGVVIVEAMKMENELRSDRDGVVKEVNVGQGAAIDAGTVLVVIE